MLFFEITHADKATRARNGVMHTDHGDIETPVFMPVGTQATVKGLDSADLENLDAQIILANAYHLHLRPGENPVSRFGGLHKFMNWNRPILTDSGGFQVFSLGKEIAKSGLSEKGECNNQAKLVKIDDNGVTFRSHIDGSTHRFTPESAIEIQHKLGADIIMAFDECTPDDVGKKYTREAMERTHRWAERCIRAHKELSSHAQGKVAEGRRGGSNQFLFGIIQGANHRELREESARAISTMNFDGIAIGGESVGFDMEATKKILDWVSPIIPKDRPHYAMGVGVSPSDLFEVVERGADMFDCVAPTRMARNGALFARTRGRKKQGEKYRININNARYADDKLPIDPGCGCSTCANYSRAYLRHLFTAQELTAYRLATIHNVFFMLNLMREMRDAIRQNRFSELKKEWT